MELSFQPSLVRERSGSVDTCRNLRPNASGYLAPATLPESVAIPRGWMPLETVRIGGSYRLLVANGSMIGLARGIILASSYRLPAEPRGVYVDRSRLIVFTERGEVSLRVDENTLAITAEPEWNVLMPRVRVEAAGTVTASIPSVDVGKAGDVNVGLGGGARSRVVAAARQAYRELNAAAEEGGVEIHPRLVWVRGVEVDGRQLFVSEPLLVAHPRGEQFRGVFAFPGHSTAEGRTAAFEVEAPAWQISLETSAELEATLPSGAVVELLKSEPLYLHDLNMAPAVHPRRRIGDAIATVAFWKSANYSLLTTNYALIKSYSLYTTNYSLPRAFASTSNAVVMAAPTRLRPAPMAAENYALTAGSGAWHAYAAVEFADGSTAVTVSEGTSGAPERFSPLLSYPAADAVALTLCVSAGGVVRRGRFPLAADESRRVAVYFHPSGLPFELPDRAMAFVAPEHNVKPVGMPEYVALASSSDPTVALALASPGPGAVTAVVPAISGQSAWDFGRSRFYLFSSDGIYVLNADPARAKMSFNLLDRRVVESARAVTRAGDYVAAVASGDVVLLRGTTVKRIASLPDVRALAWNHADRELWCIGAEEVEVICFDDDFGRYTLSLALRPEVCSAASGAVYVTGAEDSTVYRVGHGEGTAAPEFCWRGLLRWKGNAWRPGGGDALAVNLPGEYEQLKVAVTRTDGRMEAPAPDATVVVRGRISAPLRIPLNLPPTARDLLVECSGRVS